MQKRILGRTGIAVSEIAFGGVEIGMPYGIGVHDEKDMLPEKDAIALLNKALDEGINFFDTARMYGNSEILMGKAFKEKRQQVVLCTKCAHFATGKDLPSKEQLAALIQRSFQESLEALQTDYVDLFMLHTVNDEILRNETIARVFSDLKQSGKARGIGVSTYLPEETGRAIDAGIWDLVQLPFNLMDQRQRAFFPLAAQKGIGIVVRSVLLKGLLSERGKNLHPALQAVEKHIGAYQALLKQTGFPGLPALALKFALSFKEVSAVLIGIDRMEYLYRSVETADGDYLRGQVLQEAQQLAYPDPEFLNLHTWSLNGWLK